MEGLGKEGILKITGPVSDLAQDFELNVAKAEYSYIVGPSAKPILETDRNQGGTCVRLKEAECEADFRVKVSLRGTVGFPDEDRADEIPIAEIISDLIYEAEDGDESFERFHLGDDNDVIWTVGGKCHFYLTAPRRHD
ncbi:uncharacterized protein LOC101846325 [Aplysia californica]|uniref:Uncharacterized protein LOC101846325 n=1 Tax=Aplysia californica TaxID=6500 RepID=A0ABM0K9Q2_APLCA|nr:uncharacterized protein LOC101846325 [Aplysia californica]